MISTYTRLFQLLSSDIEPYQLSLGISLGFVIGLSPILSPQSIVALLLLVILRANYSVFIVSLGLVSLIAYLIDPLLDSVGRSVLTAPSLNTYFTEMYNYGFWRLLSFNNTITMGSLVITAIAILPVFLIANFLISKYRNAIEKYWKNSRLFNFIKNSKILSRMVAVSEKIN